MYGLNEAAILTYEQLCNHLSKFVYVPMKHTPNLWIHESHPTTFTLSVDDFGIKHFKKLDADHLFKALSKKYSLTINWTDTSYLGLTIYWYYDAGYVDISMPNSVPKALTKFKHIHPKRQQSAPHPWTSPVYVQKSSTPPNISLYLSKKKAHNKFKPLLVLSCTTVVLSISQSSLLLTKLQTSSLYPGH